MLVRCSDKATPQKKLTPNLARKGCTVFFRFIENDAVGLTVTAGSNFLYFHSIYLFAYRFLRSGGLEFSRRLASFSWLVRPGAEQRFRTSKLDIFRPSRTNVFR